MKSDFRRIFQPPGAKVLLEVSAGRLAPGAARSVVAGCSWSCAHQDLETGRSGGGGRCLVLRLELISCFYHTCTMPGEETACSPSKSVGLYAPDSGQLRGRGDAEDTADKLTV